MSDSMTYQSRRLLERNSLDSARVLIKKALELDPKNYEAYNNRAFLKIKENRPEKEVIEDYKKALRIKPDYEVSIYSLANLYFQLNDYKNTIDFSNQFIKLKKWKELGTTGLQQIYIIKGQSEKYIHQFDDATIDLTKAVELDQNNAHAHKELADCYSYKDQDIQFAIKEYTMAINLDSNYWKAYLGRANCFEILNPAAIKSATNDYKKALKIDPNLEDIYNTKSPLLKRLKDQAEKNGG